MEVSISCAMLVSMLAVVTMIHQMGNSAWAKVRVQTHMLQGMQVTSRQLTLELENSCPESLSVVNNAVFFLSPQDDDGNPVLGTDGRLLWQKYVGYYFDSTAGELRRVEVPLGPGSTVATHPVPLASLTAAQTGGKVLARDVEECTFELLSGTVRMAARCESDRYGRADKESLSFAWEGRPQNVATL